MQKYIGQTGIASSVLACKGSYGSNIEIG